MTAWGDCGADGSTAVQIMRGFFLGYATMRESQQVGCTMAWGGWFNKHTTATCLCMFALWCSLMQCDESRWMSHDES